MIHFDVEQYNFSLFENYPIVFKEVNPQDFDTPFITGNDKIIIEPNERGFINDEIQNNINLEDNNTVVINAGVGQGKSYAIIQTIKRYYEDNTSQRYMVILASPFVSLVKQYINDIHIDAGIPEHQIFDYNELGRTPNVSYTNKFVQVVTVNTLLGNPGEDSFKNADVKREYLNVLSQYCRDNDVKVIFIYDEIHDAYHNFRQEYIFNLWKWKDVIHKNFIISATFNEASKVVIKYLAELTNKRIKIIESKRIRFTENQSDLFLYYSDDNHFTYDTDEIYKVIKQLTDEEKNIDILCYSKTLAKKLMKPSNRIGNLLHKISEIKSMSINDCTSQLVSNNREENEEPRNQYDNTKINIGTNFKTGVSIKKENHAFVIILPPRGTRMQFSNYYGIFSGGINSIIQALARQRTKGEIHIILGKPDEFDFNSLPQEIFNTEQVNFMRQFYNNRTAIACDNKVQYFNINQQYELLNDFYVENLQNNLQTEINRVNNSNRASFPPLSFPSIDTFILENGEEYLANNYKIFGDDINAYITYASITNQFLNCKLRKAFKKVQFRIEYLNRIPQVEIEETLNNNSFYRFYQEIKQSASINFYFQSATSTYKSIFEWCYKKYYNTNVTAQRKDYLLSRVKEIRNNTITNEHQKFLYTGILYFVEKIYSEIYNHRRNYNYIIRKIPTSFSDGDKEKFSLIESNINSDEILLKFFPFKRNIIDKESIDEKIKSLIKMLRSDFLEFGRRTEIVIDGVKTPIKIVSGQQNLDE